MRKFILVSALLLASVSAQAGQNRSLSLGSADEAKPIAQVATRLAQQARIEDSTAATPAQAAPAQPQVVILPAPQAQATVQTPAPVQAQTPAPAAAESAKPATTTTTEQAVKPRTTKPVKKVQRRESDEAKARRIAARYGIHW
jgi:outer membrane biosynthesis protein TonB